MNSSIPELQRLREIRRRHLQSALMIGSDHDVALCASRLLEVDEQLNPSKDDPLFWERQTQEEQMRINAEFETWKGETN